MFYRAYIKNGDYVDYPTKRECIEKIAYIFGITKLKARKLIIEFVKNQGNF